MENGKNQQNIEFLVDVLILDYLKLLVESALLLQLL